MSYIHYDIMERSKATYTKTRFSVSSPSQCWSQTVVCVSTPMMYQRSGYFLVCKELNFLSLPTYLPLLQSQSFSSPYRTKLIQVLYFQRNLLVEIIHRLFKTVVNFSQHCYRHADYFIAHFNNKMSFYSLRKWEGSHT